MLPSVPRPPEIPASIGAFLMLAGLALMYWALTGLGALKPASSTSVAATNTPASGGGGAGAGF